MLQKLRDQTQGTGFKILVGAIIVVLTLFGFGATNLFMGTDPELARVGDFSITQNVLAVETERERMRIIAQAGPDFDPSTIDRLALSEYVVQQVVNRQVIYQAAEAVGVQVPPEEVNESLVTAPIYQENGEFSEPLYRQYIQTMGYTPVAFLDEFSNALSSETLREGVTGSLALTDWEVGQIARVLNQSRDFAYLPLEIDDFADEVEVTEDEIGLRYDEDQQNYMTPLEINAELVVLDIDVLAQDPSIEITEEMIRSLYEEEKKAALAGDQRRSSHILIELGDKRTDAEARALAEEVVARLDAGEAFDALAVEYSEDPGSKLQGGALPLIGKGVFDPAFDEALWALAEPGERSGVVETDFGLHIIQLDEIVEQTPPTLEARRDAIELEARRLEAQALFAEKAAFLEESAYDERTSLVGTAEDLEVELVEVKRVGEGGIGEDTEADPAVVELVNHPAVLAALFSDDVLAGDNSAPIALSEERVLVVRASEQFPPELKPLDAVADSIRESLIREKTLALIEERRALALTRLESGESVTEIANDLGGSWTSVPGGLRSPRTAADAAVPTEVRAYAFSLPRPAPGEKSVGSVDLANGAALVTVTRVVQGDVDATLASEVDELKRLATGAAARLDLQSLLQAAEESIGVDRPRTATEDPADV